MKDLIIATAQFENKSADKADNLMRIAELSAQSASKGAKIVVFHECSITGYTFARHLDKKRMLDIAENLTDSESIRALIQIAAVHDIAICAGLFEKDDDDNLFKAYVCVNKSGIVAKYRKLHPFINPHLSPGDRYCVFNLYGWNFGILICYDNNIIENVRATKLLGADILLMPHVTMCTPSPRPGAGFVSPDLWYNREHENQQLLREFSGPKGREWLMKWLPSRAFDNAIYCIFSNPIGMDDDQLKNGCSMILDPFGDIIAECTVLGADVAIASISQDKINAAGGTRYLRARRPELYRDIIGKQHNAEQKVAWLDSQN
ncbi:nitrilase family protein [Chryseobacterium sp. CFS15]|uniref:nitrilase family protein n=1 Tax=Chryseobacterium sp. CFS15 TaxID=2986946 RepID=UPI002808E80C|nr:nitrilase family protein [Chryseobacterium sp. CFS15]MDQ8141441.1 nitrilase family protein [Chryseobacterium sp. CFS15]